ncbi:MAG: putative fluoride ion transporter CrcB [Alphaproteobacteria bacterium MarineAlpha5_Bin2]|nr:MAG: putative fluoride ion transporter CrcB [Alphaproteobacteria bacterium MarineAlpha5_Bin2]
MINFFWVAAGGALGASLRFISSSFFNLFYPNLPIGTFFINVLGSFIVGLLINTLEMRNYSEIFIKYFLIIGVLGSYTTFSAFSYEVIELYNNKKFLLSIIYILASVFSCIVAAYAGYTINKV